MKAKLWTIGGATTIAAVATLLAAPAASAYPQGFYFGLSLGGATDMSSERSIALTPPGVCAGTNAVVFWDQDGGCAPAGPPPGVATADFHSEMIRTDFGAGFGLTLKLGYNIMGYFSAEAALAGHGGSFDEGAGHFSFIGRLHPAQFWQPHEERSWDFDIYGGWGFYSIGGYHPDANVQGNDDGKGWQGSNTTFGASFHYEVAKQIAVGIDLKYIAPSWDEWIVNFDDDYRTDPDESPKALYVMPMADITFYFE